MSDGGTIQPADQELVSTKTELARRLGIDRTTLYTHWGDSGRPEQEADGRYRVAAYVAWGKRHGFVVNFDDDDEDFSAEAFNRLKAKGLQLANALKTYQLDSLKKNYVTIEEHRDELKVVVDAARATVEDIPQQIALLTTDQAIVGRVKSVCENAMKLFHKRFAEAQKKAE